MQDQKGKLTAQADATVAEQLTAEAEAEALRRALGNTTSSLHQLAPSGSSPPPEQTNQTTDETMRVSPRRHCGAPMDVGMFLRSLFGIITVQVINAHMQIDEQGWKQVWPIFLSEHFTLLIYSS